MPLEYRTDFLDKAQRIQINKENDDSLIIISIQQNKPHKKLTDKPHKLNDTCRSLHRYKQDIQ